MRYLPSVRSRWLNIDRGLFLAFLWTETNSRFIKTQKEEQGLHPNKPGQWRIYHIAWKFRSINNKEWFTERCFSSWAQNLPSLLFLSTDTNYRQRSWKTEGSLVLSCFVMKIEIRRQRPPWPREVKPDLGTGALTDSNCVIVVLWTAKGGFSVKRHESQKSIGLNFISVLFSKCFCPPQPLQTTP